MQKVKVQEADEDNPPLEVKEEEKEPDEKAEPSQLNVLLPPPGVELLSVIINGRQTFHDEGVCNLGGGAWGTSMSVSGRPGNAVKL